MIVILWCVLAVFAFISARSASRTPANLIAPTTVVAVGFLFFFVTAYISLDEGTRSFIDSRGYEKLLIVAVSFESLFVAGYRIGMRSSTRSEGRVFEPVDLRRTIVVLVSLATVGSVSFLARSGGVGLYYGSPHGAGGAWETTSAYLYELTLLYYPALLLLYVGFLTKSNARWFDGFFLVVVSVLAVDAWIVGKRGAWIRLLVVLSAPFFLVKRTRRAPQALLYAIVLVTLSVILLTPYTRHATYLGADVRFVDAIEDLLTQGINPFLGSSRGEGNELAFSSALVQSATRTQSFDWGLRWLYPVVNFVPRAVWKDKPYRNEWTNDYESSVYYTEGWIVGFGAAPGGVADTFATFGWAGGLAWFAFGVWGGRVWKKATSKSCASNIASLCGYLIGLAYMITQDFHAAFYAWFFFTVPAALLARVLANGRLTREGTILKGRPGAVAYE